MDGRPDRGRDSWWRAAGWGVLSPVMPWPSFAQLTDADVKAIVAYLHSLKPAKNKVPGLFPAGKEPGVPVFRLTSPS